MSISALVSLHLRSCSSPPGGLSTRLKIHRNMLHICQVLLEIPLYLTGFCPSLLPKDHNTEVMLMTEVPTSHPREAQSINWDVGKINSMPLKPQLLVLPPLRAQTLH